MLSGTGTDGTLGLRAIKEYGGMAIAQTLDSAKYDAILRSAIATGLVDHVLAVEEMPAKLLDYAAHLVSANGNGAPDTLPRRSPRICPAFMPYSGAGPGMISASTRKTRSPDAWSVA